MCSGFSARAVDAFLRGCLCAIGCQRTYETQIPMSIGTYAEKTGLFERHRQAIDEHRRSTVRFARK